MPEIRMATPNDAEQMLAIYTPYITDNSVSFEVIVPSVTEFQQRLATTLQRHPWLACESDGHVIGYAYASQHRERKAYQWSADCSVYVDPANHRGGIATALYTSLFACLRLQGFINVIAGITQPNPASKALHQRMGFESVGTYEHVGYKFGAWRDVWWGQLTLAALPDPPSPPKPIADVSTTPAWQNALAEGQRLLT